MNAGLEVLDAMAAYVRNFFGCRHCALHFGHMYSTTVKRSNMSSPDTAVLWLWEAHNRVNKRLAGDPSEDPEAPKIQFPSAEMCPGCRGDEGDWDRDAVLAFLKTQYAFDKTKFNGTVYDPLDDEVDADDESHTNGARSQLMPMNDINASLFALLGLVTLKTMAILNG